MYPVYVERRISRPGHLVTSFFNGKSAILVSNDIIGNVRYVHLLRDVKKVKNMRDAFKARLN